MADKTYNKSEYNKDRPYNKVEKSRTFLQKRKESGKANHATTKLEPTRPQRDDILKTLDKKGKRQIAKTTSRANRPKSKSKKNHNVIDFGSIISNLVWMGVILFIFADMPFIMKVGVVVFFGGQIVWGIIKPK